MLFGPGDGILAALEGFHRLFQQATTTQYVDRSPIVLDLDGNGVQTTAVNTGAFFDHDANGFAESTGWVNPNDGFLVLDRNGDGRIDSGRELFGNETLLASGEKAANGFAALAELDSNGDDVIDTNDSAFASLKVWKDTDGDGFSLPSELLSLEEAGVRSINVGYSNSSFVDANGNQHRQIGSFTRTDGSVGAAEDVWFQRDTMNTIAEEWIAVPADIAALPDLRGYGNMYDLHQAMVRDTSGQLEALVQGFIGENDVPARNALFEQILFKWAGVDTIDPLSRNGIDGFHIDARQLGVLEKFFGEQFVGIYGPNPMYDSGLLLKASYQGLFEMMYAELMAQTHLKSEYDAITYRFDTQSQSLKGDISPAFAVLGAEYAANPSAAIADAQDFERSIYALQEVAMFDIDSRLRGTDGNDLIVSSAQGRNDTIDGGAGNDTIIDAGGNNVIDGGDGSDSIALAALSSNVVRGGAGDDVISVASYSSPYWIRQGIEFNFGCNTITGGTGNDTLIGGAELDTYVFNRSDGQDSILDNSVYQQTGWWWGGVTSVDSGLTDTLQFGAEVNASDLSVHLSGDDLVLTINDPSNPNPDPAAVDQITIRNWALGSNYWIENVQFADGTTLHSADLNAIAETGTEGNDVLTGFLGLGLTYRGLGGDDTINAQGGNDTIYGGDGNDTITDLGGSNYIDGGGGDDTIAAQSGNDTIYGGDGNDMITDTGGSNYISGGGGDDTIAAQSGNDTIYGGEGNDTITDSGGANFIDGGAGDDTVVVSGSSLGNNTLLGGDGSDVLSLGQVDRYAEASYSNTFEG
ncbi:MAG TPA: calcium-binding protein, partial [Acidobacteriaceae bacterium]